jgi:hypothetical protein
VEKLKVDLLRYHFVDFKKSKVEKSLWLRRLSLRCLYLLRSLLFG